MSDTMQAAICTGYGGPEKLVIQSRPRPVPRADGVLIEVEATTVNSGDMRIRSQNMPKGFGLPMRLVMGWNKPRRPILGTELTGTIVAVGEKVTRFEPGDKVIAFPGVAMGAHAQFIAMSENAIIVHRPENLSVEQAAALCFGGTTAHDFLRKAQFDTGESILVIGASGTVGSALVQLARHQGGHVTAVTSSTNLETAKSLGAHETIDYTATDYTAARDRYDVIADCVAASSFGDCFDALKPSGRYLAIAGGLADMFKRGHGGKRQIARVASERTEDVEHLAELAREGHFVPLVGRTFAFADIAKAHAHVETGHKLGSTVIMMA